MSVAVADCPPVEVVHYAQPDQGCIEEVCPGKDAAIWSQLEVGYSYQLHLEAEKMAGTYTGVFA